MTDKPIFYLVGYLDVDGRLTEQPTKMYSSRHWAQSHFQIHFPWKYDDKNKRWVAQQNDWPKPVVCPMEWTDYVPKIAREA